MAWKKLVSARGLSNRHSILVSASGDLSIGAAVYDLLGCPDRIVLFWDTDRDLLGLKPAKDGETGAVRVAKPASAETSSRRIGAKFAFQQAGVKPARAIYTPKSDGELLCIGPLARVDTPPVSAVREMVRAAR